MSHTHSMRLLVLGLGNVLCGDDGVGPAVVAELGRRYAPPEGACVVDGGTLGLSLLPLLADAEHVLLVDAVLTGDAPGTLVRLRGDDVTPAVRSRLSVHQVGVADLLDGLRLCGHWPRRLGLVGVVPVTFELQLGRSPAVERAVPALVEAVVEEAARWGHVFARIEPAKPAESDEIANAPLGVDHGRRALEL